MPRRRPKGFQKPKRARYGLWCGLAIVLLCVLYGLLLANSRPEVSGDRLRVDQFVDLAENGKLDNARLLDQDAVFTGTYTRPDGAHAEYNVAYSKKSQERLLTVLQENKVPFEVQQQFLKQLVQPATIMIPALIMIVIFIYLLLSYNRGEGLFAIRSGARMSDPRQGRATFAQVAGQDAAVAELREIRDFLSHPQRFLDLGAAVPRGILLFGPPGCGKTLLARAVAGEAGAAFYSISGSDFVELYVGVGAARVRELFREARRNSPAIVFIDELDAVGRRRGGGAAVGSSEEQEQALNQILSELDGFSPLEGVIVIGATNRPDILDPALLRPGRFDRTIGLERPDERARLAILTLHATSKPMDANVDLADVAKRGIGLSGADLASVVNEAALLAARAGRAAVSRAELDAALTRILEAPERQRRLSMRGRGFARSTGGDERVTFADVAGVDGALVELAEVKEYLTEPERFVDMGARPPRGLLLAGPPGCGKTLLARALATEANAAFFSVAATEFVEVFAGEGAARVRDLFAEARSVAPSIVFLDEIDAVGARRGATVDGNREREQTLNQILVELDGFQARAGVIVMAASNRPEILDPALVRAGRFDRTISVDLPDRGARSRILQLHAAGKPLAADVDLEAAAALTQGYSGADLANVMNEAALLAARRRLFHVPMALVEEAIERVGRGLAQSRRLAPPERKAVAYHEAGHALVGRALPGAAPPHKISIVARGRVLGATTNVDVEDRSLYPKSALIDRLAALLGGRVAEELVFGQPISGAADDLRQVAQIARWMVCEVGMGEGTGPLAYPDTDGEGQPRPYSEETARAIDAEVQRLVQEAHQRARKVLAADRGALDRTARALFDNETITADDLERLAGAVAPGPAVAAGGTRQVAGPGRP